MSVAHVALQTVGCGGLYFPKKWHKYCLFPVYYVFTNMIIFPLLDRLCGYCLLVSKRVEHMLQNYRGTLYFVDQVLAVMEKLFKDVCVICSTSYGNFAGTFCCVCMSCLKRGVRDLPSVMKPLYCQNCTLPH